MFEAEHRQIREYLDSVSQRRSYHIIPIKEDQSHIYQIASAFQRNELVCMHADRFIPGNKTVKMNFLGEAASFPIGPFTIAAVFRVPVTFVFAFKESSTHYHFYSTTPALFSKEAKREEIISGLMATFVNKLEELAKKYPLQWL
jgi:predicted LPLAT superfamily acyltransferase